MARKPAKRPKKARAPANPLLVGGELIVTWRWLVARHDDLVRALVAAEDSGDTGVAAAIDAELGALVAAIAKLNTARDQRAALRRIVERWPIELPGAPLARAYHALHRLLKQHPIDVVLGAIDGTDRTAILELQDAVSAARAVVPARPIEHDKTEQELRAEMIATLRRAIVAAGSLSPSERAAATVADLASGAAAPCDRARVFRAVSLEKQATRTR